MQYIGRGRKELGTPLTKDAQQALRCWLKKPRKRGAAALFPNMHGGKLSVQALLNSFAQARVHCVSESGSGKPSNDISGRELLLSTSAKLSNSTYLSESFFSSQWLSQHTKRVPLYDHYTQKNDRLSATTDCV